MMKNKNKTTESGNLLEILEHSNGWISAAQIKRYTGLNPREIRRLTTKLRYGGHPIVSGNKGYKIAKSKQEIGRCIARMKSQAKMLNEVAEILSISASGLPEVANDRN